MGTGTATGTEMDQLIPQHLDDTALIEYLDGELSHSARKRAYTHIQRCWTCRGRLNTLQKSIDNFLRVQQELHPDDSSASSYAVAQFRKRLARHREELALAQAGRLPLSLSSLSYRRAAAILLVGAVVGMALLNPFTEPISAETILTRANTYEYLHVRMSQNVVRSSVKIARIDSSAKKEKSIGTVELAQDCNSLAAHLSARADSGETSNKMVQDREKLSAAFPFASEFEQSLMSYFVSSGWFPDVSVSAYQKLIAEREDNRSTAVRRGNRFELRHPFAPGHRSGITETLLTVDAESYSPLSISVFAFEGSDRREYRFTRTSLELVERTPEIARLFSTGDEVLRPARPRTTPEVAQPAPNAGASVNPSPRPLSYFNSRATDEEIRVAFALHQLDACLGEEINIFPMSDGSLLVQGLLDRAGRKEAISRALSALNLPLHAEVYTAADLKSGTELYDPPDRLPEKAPVRTSQRSEVVSMGQLSGGKIALSDRLFEYFSKKAKDSGSDASDEKIKQQIAAFSNEVVSISSRALFHAWALKKLDVEFSHARASGLSQSALKELEKMRSDHRLSISKASRRLALLLNGISPPTASALESEGARLESEALLRLVIEQDELVRELFTSSAQAQRPEDGLNKLMRLTKQLN